MSHIRAPVPLTLRSTMRGFNRSRLLKAISLSLGQTLLALLFVLYAPTGRAQPITLTLVHGAPVEHPANLAALQFARRVAERTGGQVKIEVFPDNQLGNLSEQLWKVKLGAIDMAVVGLNNLNKYDRTFSVVLLPYVFDSYEHAHRVFDGPAMDWLAPLAEKQGFILLSNWEWGFRNLTNNVRPINQPKDIRGLKIRVPPGPEDEATFDALGGQTSKIALAEVYRALELGLVDGQDNPIAVIYFNKYYEVQKYLALTRHTYTSLAHIINAKSWARLSPAQQAIIREESRVAGDAMRRAIVADEDVQIAKMERHGMRVTRPDTKPFRAMAEPAYKKIAADIGEANVQKFLKMVDDARKK